MNITILSVGKIKDKWFAAAQDEYEKRISRFAKLRIVELADEAAPKNASAKDIENLMKKEGPDAGGAAYNERTAQAGTSTNRQGKVSLRAYGSMTYAAVLSMCSAKLDRGDPRVRQSLEYMTKHWSIDENPGMGSQGLYYFYDIMARALSAAKVDIVGGHDWKKELSRKIISLQKPDGSWYNDNNRFWESDPVLCTSFAMLVLELCRER